MGRDAHGRRTGTGPEKAGAPPAGECGSAVACPAGPIATTAAPAPGRGPSPLSPVGEEACQVAFDLPPQPLGVRDSERLLPTEQLLLSPPPACLILSVCLRRLQSQGEGGTTQTHRPLAPILPGLATSMTFNSLNHLDGQHVTLISTRQWKPCLSFFLKANSPVVPVL